MIGAFCAVTRRKSRLRMRDIFGSDMEIKSIQIIVRMTQFARMLQID